MRERESEFECESGLKSEMEISTPSSSSKPLSITPGSRVLKSPLSDEQIWKRLRDAGFDEVSIKQKDKAALVAYIAKLEAEVRSSEIQFESIDFLGF